MQSYTAPHAPTALRPLLAGAIDYAGLFPPARLDMPDAVAAYASYLDSADAWALGRFVVPVARLDEMAAAAGALPSTRDHTPPARSTPWRLSALLGADASADMSRVRAFNDKFEAPSVGNWRARIDMVEVKAATEAAVRDVARAVARELVCYVEIPTAGDPAPLVRAIADAGACAKVRTGGITGDAFPASGDLLRFLAACVTDRVPFKATAGLHHPLRGVYALTYESESARGTMFGFLNVVLATAFLRAGAGEQVALGALEESSADAVTFLADGAAWRGHQLSRSQLVAARELAMRSFGSCSFREPIDDLAALGML